MRQPEPTPVKTMKLRSPPPQPRSIPMKNIKVKSKKNRQKTNKFNKNSSEMSTASYKNSKEIVFKSFISNDSGNLNIRFTSLLLK